MKKWIRRTVIALSTAALLATGAALVSCGANDDGGNSSGGGNTSQVTYELNLSMDEFTMNVYEEILLNAVIKEDGQTINSAVAWTSSDSSVAMVEDGKVVALKTGTATITATANGVSDSCVITVVDTAGSPQIIVDIDDVVQLLVGDSFQVQPTLVYNGSTYTDATYTYHSADEQIFTVDENGLITAVLEGEADLTVSANWRGLSGTDLTEVIHVKVIDVGMILAFSELIRS